MDTFSALTFIGGIMVGMGSLLLIATAAISLFIGE